MKKILVIGNLGYVGTVLITYLKKNNCYVKGIDTNFFYFPDQENPNKDLPHEQLFKDIRNVTEEDVKGYQNVIFLAALSNDPLGRIDEGLTLEINYKSVLRLAKMCQKNGCKKFVFASSCSVYGFLEDQKDVITENYRCKPLTEYARSKYQCEKKLNLISSKKFKVTCLRFGTACGVSRLMRFDLVLNDMVANAFFKNKILILSDGKPWRPMIDVKDMSKLFFFFLKNNIKKNFNVLNAGGKNCNYTVLDLAKEIKKVYPKCSIQILNQNPNDKRSYKVSLKKLNDITYKKIKFTPIKKSIKEIFNWLKFHDKIKKLSDTKNMEYIRLSKINYLKNKKVINDKFFWN
jgi:nucleoside-diphosphate-sugar epimerase